MFVQKLIDVQCPSWRELNQIKGVRTYPSTNLFEIILENWYVVYRERTERITLWCSLSGIVSANTTSALLLFFFLFCFERVLAVIIIYHRALSTTIVLLMTVL